MHKAFSQKYFFFSKKEQPSQHEPLKESWFVVILVS